MTASGAAGTGLVFALCLALSACTAGSGAESNSMMATGNAHEGKQLIGQYGCGACHIVPGVRGARGLVGPPLYYWGDRTMIAGELPNTPDNLIRWLENPKAIEPKNAMPDLGLSQEQATDIAAYLYTLHRSGD